MACFSIVLGAAIAGQGMKTWIKDRIPYSGVLLTLLWGGAIVLIVDHLMNGELFLIGGNILWDLFVGVVMTTSVFVIWGLYVVVERSLKNAHGYAAQ